MYNEVNLVGEKIMDMNLAINVVFCGVAIVFLMLILLIAVMYIFGLTFSKKSKEKTVEPVLEKKVEKTVEPITAMVVDDLDDETVAAITAAIYCLYNGSDVTPKITFIKPANARPAWAKAGIAQNTRAF